ncbi:hypothetical protein [Nocardia neocaledoniensis]|uniref:hypothetical protein n=1 Tax=Nocardia neocaledoniensis TaxID=236511 RepID=UPI002457DB08|nr:hypothetical protein [Nocardia neocaledoniensis]
MHTVMHEGEHAAARRFLKDSADAHALPWDDVEETHELIDAMTGEQLRAAIRRTWGEWEQWRIEFADDIAAEAAIERDQDWAEFDAAARRRLYGAHMYRARPWVSCTARGPEAVAEIGAHVIESRRHIRETWAEIARRLGVPKHVALVWSVETRVRDTADALTRPFRNALNSKKES